MSAPHAREGAREGARERPWEYSAFAVEVSAVSRVGAGFVRVTLRGDSLRHFAPWGVDQRIKVVLPLADGSFTDVGLLDEPTPHPSDWYSRWRLLPEARRNVLRTFTPSAIRIEQREIDVDFFLHSPAGPASEWAAHAVVGQPLIITGPDIRRGWTGYGLHWQPHDRRRFLLIADETALPALRNIVRTLPQDHRAVALLAVADIGDDLLSAEAPPNVEVRVVREDRRSMPAICRAVREWSTLHGAAARDDTAFGVWMAGEAGDITEIRRHLTRDVGIAKDRISFLGYWRRGGPLVA